MVNVFFSDLIKSIGKDYEPFNGVAIVFAIVTSIILGIVFQYYKVIKLREEISKGFYDIDVKEKHVISLIAELQDVTDKLVDHELQMSVKNTYSELVEEDKVSEHLTTDGNQSRHNRNESQMESYSNLDDHHETMTQVLDIDANKNQRRQNDKQLENQSSSDVHHENMSQMSDKVTRLVERIERDTKGSANQGLDKLMLEIKSSQTLVMQARLDYNDTVSSYNLSIYSLLFVFFRKTLGFVEKPYI